MTIVITMNYLSNDCITCIIDRLEYIDLLNLSETCKKFASIRSFTIFREKKNRFHDFNKTIANNGKFMHEMYNIYYIEINNKCTAEVYRKSHPLGIKCYLYCHFLTSLGYNRLISPFTWPTYLWKKIKDRFPGFTMIEMKCHPCYYVWTNASIDTLEKFELVFVKSSISDYNFFYINQIRMLYHIFKYFKNDIIIYDNNRGYI